MVDEPLPPQLVQKFYITDNELTYVMWQRLGRGTSNLFGGRGR